MSTIIQSPNIAAYLLRCWMEGSIWRYSLEEVGTGKKHGFATLDEFISFMLVRSTQPCEIEKSGLEVDPQESELKESMGANSSSCDER